MIPDFILNPDPRALLTDNYIVVDFETTNLDKGSALNPDNRIVLVSWLYRGIMTSEVVTEFALHNLKAAIEAAALLVAHNAKFELQWLSRAGMDISKLLIYDTMLGEYIIRSNLKGIKLDLGSVADGYGYGTKDAYIDQCMKDGICPSNLPTSMLRARCEKDVRQTDGVYKAQSQQLLTEGLLPVMFTKCLFTPVLADIEARGLHLDCDRVESTYREVLEQFQEVSEQLHVFTDGINMRSPQQVAFYLYNQLGFKELTDRMGNPIRGKPTKKFPDGTPKADRVTISKLKLSTKRQRMFLELLEKHSSLAAALSKSLEFFIGACRERDGVFYGQYNQSVTSTQRLSSSGRAVKFKCFSKAKSVQLQNLPRKYKRLFSPKQKDFVYAEVDGAQLEFRVAGHLCRDKQAIQDIIDNIDVHRFTAQTLTDAGQPTDRQGAKAHTFKPLYGGSSGTKAEQAYYNAFKTRYSGIARQQQEWVMEVLSTKELRTETGLIFYWPDIYMSHTGYVKNKEAICNYPVQYFATGEIIPIAITRLWHELIDNGLKSHIVNTIHDSSPLEVHVDETDIVTNLAISAYTTHVYSYLKQVYNIDFVAPLGVGIKIGDHWGEGEEIKVNVNPTTKLPGVNYKEQG